MVRPLLARGSTALIGYSPLTVCAVLLPLRSGRDPRPITLDRLNAAISAAGGYYAPIPLSSNACTRSAVTQGYGRGYNWPRRPKPNHRPQPESEISAIGCQKLKSMP